MPGFIIPRPPPIIPIPPIIPMPGIVPPESAPAVPFCIFVSPVGATLWAKLRTPETAKAIVTTPTTKIFHAFMAQVPFSR